MPQRMGQTTKIHSADAPQIVVLVLGMHRSGTSLLASLIRALGVNVGESLYPPDVHNPAGYFEDEACMQIQERMLTTLGQPWSEAIGMLPFPHRWWREPEMGPLVAELEAWIDHRSQNAGPIWAFKDPRTTRFLPLWHELLQIRGLAPRYVLAVRDPDEVAASEVARDGVPPERVYRTWLRYNMEALIHAGSELAGIFMYGDWFTDGVPHLRRLARILGLCIEADASAAILATVLREDLYRSNSPPNIAAPTWASYLYSSLRELSRNEGTHAAATLATEAEYIDALLQQGEKPELTGPLVALLLSGPASSEALGLVTRLRAEGARVVLSVPSRLSEPVSGVAVVPRETDGPPLIGRVNTCAAYVSWLWLQCRAYAELHLEGGSGLATHFLDARRFGWLDGHGTLHIWYFEPPSWLDEDGRLRLRNVDDIEALCLEQRVIGLDQRKVGGSNVLLHATPPLHAILKSAVEEEFPISQPDTLETEPLVSVCITHFNRPALLHDCLTSVRAQTYRRIEVVLVDDGSTLFGAIAFLDGLIEEFKAKDWRLIRKENGYLGAARNAAINVANGDYIFVLDDDNLLRPEGIACAVQIAQRTGADIVTATMARFHGSPGARPTWAEELRVFPGHSALGGLFDNSLGDANALVRRDLLCRIGGFTEDRGIGAEDWEFFSKAVLQGARLEHSVQPLSWYRVDPRSMSHSGNWWHDYRRALRPYEACLPLTLRELPALAGLLSRRNDALDSRQAESDRKLAEIEAELGRSTQQVAMLDHQLANAEAKATAGEEAIAKANLEREGKERQLLYMEERLAAAQALTARAEMVAGQVRIERDALLHENAYYRALYGALRRSTSWRVTLPMRVVKRVLSSDWSDFGRVWHVLVRIGARTHNQRGQTDSDES